MTKLRRKQADLVLGSLPDCVFANYDFKCNAVVVDAESLSELVKERVAMAKEVGLVFGDWETVWIWKFASVVSHETIQKVLAELECRETSQKFDGLYFAEFMEKIPPKSIHVVLWSDAFETCPIGDTWFS